MNLSVFKHGLNRESTFGFSCGRCMSCCRNKKIQLNPYEIARMASNLGISTTEFIADYTARGTILKNREDGTCIFLETNGCSIHPDRPLVCRLYPLGRHIRYPWIETFSQFESEPECKGRFNQGGTIETYLETQGAFAFMRAADLYLELLCFLLETLKDKPLSSGEADRVLETVQNITEGKAGENELKWIDMDQTIADFCRRSGQPVPSTIDEKMALHITAVRKWAA
ncbi:MAG: YkgJ family cysteine cluster protein [Deltaproteobacteria bacterium]|nr:YkgJ family cysteine cluster protein [Deltaproteobacteria bacterium]